jgi:hypothetical protein
MRNLNNDDLLFYSTWAMVFIDGEGDDDELQTVIDVFVAFSSSGIDGLDVKKLGGYAVEDIKAMGIEGPAKVTKYNLAKADAALQRNICLALAKVALADGHVADDEIIFFNDCLEIAGLTIDDLK